MVHVNSDEQSFVDYYRCPAGLAPLGPQARLSNEEGYFTFQQALCYGRSASGRPAANVTDSLDDLGDAVRFENGRAQLPFALSEVVANFRLERYCRNGRRVLERMTSAGLTQSLYYALRPFMRVGVRKHLQKIRLNGWERIAFPRWPVDLSVDALMERTMAVLLRDGVSGPMPFIWFWPEGAAGCAMMTHDVEGPAGMGFCEQLMNIDEAFDIKSAFQLVPQGQETEWQRLASRLRRRGFEVNLHDLNHDGLLFRNRAQFLERATLINRYAREFECAGFRSAAMYREQAWFDAFEFSYDMSVPNAAHLEPQRGGCCTVMPYFIGNLLELPLTTVQDYSLFHILGDYSTTLWERQIELILARHGLISVITHPDYLLDAAERRVYEKLLQHLSRLRDTRNIWVARPSEIDRWWRSRHAMRLVAHGDSWRIEGPDAQRARVAFASIEDGQVVYRCLRPGEHSAAVDLAARTKAAL